MSILVMFLIMRLAVMFWLIIGIVMFAYKYKKRPKFVLRASITSLICLGISALVGWLGLIFMSYLKEIGLYNSFVFPALNLVVHILLYGLAIGWMFICFDEKPVTILFGSIAGYATQNIAMIVTNILGVVWPATQFITQDPVTVLNFSVWLSSYITVYIIIYFIFARNIRETVEVAEFNSKSTVILFFVVISVAVALRSIASAYTTESGVLFVLVCICNIVCCLVVLFVQFLLTRRMIEQRENDALRHISELKMKQYEFTKENIDIINLKCHDLKHQLLELKNKGSVDKQYIDELSRSVLFYDSVLKTGNDALDIVITEKNLYCSQNEIKLTIMANGSVLSFMRKADIYSLFGNALDNAIEHVINVPPEKRVIKLSVSVTGSLISISIKNYYEGKDPEFVSGLPKTTKKNKTVHGYGVKSIKNIAESYGGSFSAIVEKNQFIISILIPAEIK